MLSYPVRVKVLCLISGIEPVFRWRTHPLKERLGLLKEDLTTKGGQKYAIGSHLLGQLCLFPRCWEQWLLKAHSCSMIRTLTLEEWELPFSGEHTPSAP